MRPEHRIEITHYSTLDNLLNTAVEQLGARAFVEAVADYLFESEHSDAILARWAKDYAENDLPFPTNAAVNALPSLLAVAEAASAIIDAGDLDLQQPIEDRKAREKDLRRALSLLPNAPVHRAGEDKP